MTIKKKKDKWVVTDVDDCVDNWIGDLCRAHNYKHGTCIVETDIHSWGFQELEFKDARGNIVTGKDLDATLRHWEPNGFYAAMSLLENSKFAIETMQAIGYKVMALTARPEQYKEATNYHFLKEGIKFDNITFDWDKVKVINELSGDNQVVMFVDDKLDTVKAVHEKCKVAQVCLMTKGHNQAAAIDDEIKRVSSLLESLRYLKKVNK
jgi:hypothetical protein